MTRSARVTRSGVVYSGAVNSSRCCLTSPPPSRAASRGLSADRNQRVADPPWVGGPSLTAVDPVQAGGGFSKLLGRASRLRVVGQAGSRLSSASSRADPQVAPVLRVLDDAVALLGRLEPRRDGEACPVANPLELDRLRGRARSVDGRGGSFSSMREVPRGNLRNTPKVGRSKLRGASQLSPVHHTRAWADGALGVTPP